MGVASACGRWVWQVGVAGGCGRWVWQVGEAIPLLVVSLHYFLSLRRGLQHLMTTIVKDTGGCVVRSVCAEGQWTGRRSEG